MMGVPGKWWMVQWGGIQCETPGNQALGFGESWTPSCLKVWILFLWWGVGRQKWVASEDVWGGNWCCMLIAYCLCALSRTQPPQVRLVVSFVHSYTPRANPGLAHSRSSVDSWWMGFYQGFKNLFLGMMKTLGNGKDFRKERQGRKLFQKLKWTPTRLKMRVTWERTTTVDGELRKAPEKLITEWLLGWGSNMSPAWLKINSWLGLPLTKAQNSEGGVAPKLRVGRSWEEKDNGFAFGKVESEVHLGNSCGHSKGQLGVEISLGQEDWSEGCGSH